MSIPSRTFYVTAVTSDLCVCGGDAGASLWHPAQSNPTAQAGDRKSPSDVSEVMESHEGREVGFNG